MRKRILAFAAAVSLAACASQKGPADAALKAAQAAFDAAKGQASQFVPEQAKGVQDALAAAQDAFNKGDYKAALAAAQDVSAQAGALAQAAAAKKEELTKAWTEMAAGLPQMIEPIRSRMDMLSKAKKLPANLDKDKYELAKGGFESVTKTWEEASAAASAGNVVEAVAKANAVKAKAAEVLGLLGMPVPEAAAAAAPPAK